jgi:hypothetical protein
MSEAYWVGLTEERNLVVNPYPQGADDFMMTYHLLPEDVAGPFGTKVEAAGFMRLIRNFIAVNPGSTLRQIRNRVQM